MNIPFVFHLPIMSILALTFCLKAHGEDAAISLTAECDQKSYKSGATITIDTTWTNSSKNGVMLYNTDHYHGWRYTFTDGDSIEWTATCLARIRYTAKTIVLEPGASHKVKVNLDRKFVFLKNKKGPSVKALPPGEYQLVVSRDFREHPKAAVMDTIYGFWTGTVESKPMTITIKK